MTNFNATGCYLTDQGMMGIAITLHNEHGDVRQYNTSDSLVQVVNVLSDLGFRIVTHNPSGNLTYMTNVEG